MKSNISLGLIVALSLLLGLSFGQLHDQHKTIQALRQQAASARQPTISANAHTRCVRLMKRQHMRMQVEHYHRALEALARESLLEVEVYSEPLFNLSQAARHRR